MRTFNLDVVRVVLAVWNNLLHGSQIEVLAQFAVGRILVVIPLSNGVKRARRLDLLAFDEDVTLAFDDAGAANHITENLMKVSNVVNEPT